MKRKPKIICVHSLKPEYVEYMPYLKSLTKENLHGKLKFKNGFMSSVLVFLDGKNNILSFFYKDNNNYLGWTEKFSFLEYFGIFGRFFLNCLINIKALFDKKHLMITYNVPIKKLKYFNTEVRSWKRKDVDFIFLYKLDNIAHKHGTFSKQVIKYLKKTDERLKKMDFDILFSDHGMMDVKKTIKLPESKICFMDSTIARYWGDEKELKEIKNKLPMKQGKIINWDDKKYGQLIFQVNPGLLISPNYWQGDKKIKAMHGYDADLPEMKGFYLIKEKGKRKDISIEELHEIYVGKK